MAITIDSGFLSNPSFAKSDVIIKCTSNRDYSDAFIITGVTSGTGGYSRYAVTPHTLKVGDVIKVTSSSNTAYYVAQTVTVINAAWFETDFIYAGAMTGTVRRNNKNFSIKADVYMLSYSIEIDIISVASSGGLSQLTFSNPFKFVAGNIIKLYGMSDAGYDGVHIVKSVLADDSILIDKAYIANATGKGIAGDLVGSKSIIGVSNGAFSEELTYTINCNTYLYSRLEFQPQVTQTNFIGSNHWKWYKEFAVIFTEKFDDKNGLQTSGDSSTISGWKVLRGYKNEYGNDKALVMGSSSASTSFMTNSPRVIDVGAKQTIELPFLKQIGTSTQYAGHLSFFDFSGVPVGNITTSLTAIERDNGYFTFSTDIAPSDTYRIEAALHTTGGVRVSEIKTYYLKHKCGHTILLFENQFGRTDSVCIVGDSEVVTNPSKKFYSNGDGDKNIYGLTTETTYTLTTQVFNSEQGIWLRELINSANVYIWLHDLNEYRKIIIVSDKELISSQSQNISFKINYVFAKQTRTHSN
jgi:hypothetical protein